MPSDAADGRADAEPLATAADGRADAEPLATDADGGLATDDPRYSALATSGAAVGASGLSIAEQVDLVPTKPGCYLWKGASGEVLYVGKAKNLRARMRQYTTLTDERVKIPLLMEQVRSFEYIVVSNEHEALVLEMNLIRQYDPPFNVDFRDDKSYPYIAVTEDDVFPAIKFTRERHRKGTRYFGPYTNARAARETIDLARKVVPLCLATCPEWRRVKRMLDRHPDDAPLVEMELAGRGRPCFDASVGIGPGVCAGEVSSADYGRNVRAIERFLSGHRGEFEDLIADEMREAAAGLDFERAARCRDRLAALRRVSAKQQVVFPSPIDMDVIGFWRQETIAGAHVFAVREGKTVRSCEFVLDKGQDVSEDELTQGFLKRYYAGGADIPDEVDVATRIDDGELIASWLTERHGRKVSLHVPQRGEKRRLLEMAQENAKHTLMRFMMRTSYEDERINQALLQLESALALPAPPLRIECFDISTIHGRFTVASMVVFTNGRPDTSQYRRFKVRAQLDEANDFLSMREVLGRRYAPERMADGAFGSRPDLLILDGGKPQLSAAMEQLSELGLDIPMAGLAKSDEELFVPWDETPVVLPSGSPSLYLVKHVRDESHRFAITFHRELRGKAMTVGILDEIPGIGPKRRKALMKQFGSIKRLRAAGVEEIAQTPGVSADLAAAVYETMRGWDEEREEVRERAEAAVAGDAEGAAAGDAEAGADVEKTGGARAGAVEAAAVEKADDADAAAGAGGGEGAR